MHHVRMLTDSEFWVASIVFNWASLLAAAIGVHKLWKGNSRDALVLSITSKQTPRDTIRVMITAPGNMPVARA